MFISVGMSSRRAKSSHAVLLIWRSSASEILADCETQPSPTLPKQISEKDAIETILHNSQLKSHSEQFETEYYLAPVQASNLRRQRSVA
jgi:hypothetical protein